MFPSSTDFNSLFSLPKEVFESNILTERENNKTKPKQHNTNLKLQLQWKVLLQ